MSRVQTCAVAGTLVAWSVVHTLAQPIPPRREPPTAPANLAAVAVSSTAIRLTWTDSIDNVAVTGYLVERCAGGGCSGFAQIGTSRTSPFDDSGLGESSTSSYRVRAVDTDGNLSAYSGVASATTLTVGDAQPPSPPSDLIATTIASDRIDLA